MNGRRKRLLVLASTFPANTADSAPAFVRDLAAVEAEHFETTVLVPSVPGGLAQESLGMVQVQRFRYFPRRWEDLADGAILENLRQRPTRWLQVIPFIAAEAVALWRIARRERVDVLHVHWIVPQGLAALLGGRHIPMLVTTLGGDLYGLRDPISRWIIRAVVRRARVVTTMNQDMRDRLIELGARPDQVLVLPMGADVPGIRALVAGVAAMPSRVLFVGRLVEKKGLAVLLAAIPAIASADPAFVLHVVGDGPLREELRSLAAGLPVVFLGALHRDELAREYAAASVVVFPSVPASSGDQDGLPVALLEAMAAGRTVVASDMPGLRDAVVDGESGLLVPPADPVALAAAVCRTLADPQLAARLAAGASASAEEYSVATIGARYAELLREAMYPAPGTRDGDPEYGS